MPTTFGHNHWPTVLRSPVKSPTKLKLQEETASHRRTARRAALAMAACGLGRRTQEALEAHLRPPRRGHRSRGHSPEARPSSPLRSEQTRPRLGHLLVNAPRRGLFESGIEVHACSALGAEFHRGDTTPVTWRRLYGERLPQALEKFRRGEAIEELALASVRNRLKGLSHTQAMRTTCCFEPGSQ